MKLAKFRHPNGSVGIGSIEGVTVTPMNLSGGQFSALSDILESDNPLEAAEFLADTSSQLNLGQVTLLPPIDEQEVWAAGVTYQRSQAARKEESTTSASCYDRVYEASRPELFFKATPHRVVGPGEHVRIRRDSKWTVPEPELTLVLNSHLQLVGFTVGNDMSARDIEGDNPLYLPQAKIYDASCSLGPCITLPGAMPPEEDVSITMKIFRDDRVVFEGNAGVDQMARSLDTLISWLGRENSFPSGVFLLTGTGIVPESEFSLRPGDRVEITIAGIGTLVNTVEQG